MKIKIIKLVCLFAFMVILHSCTEEVVKPKEDGGTISPRDSASGLPTGKSS